MHKYLTQLLKDLKRNNRGIKVKLPRHIKVKRNA